MFHAATRGGTRGGGGVLAGSHGPGALRRTRLLVAVDEALDRPRRLDVVDVGAGGAHLLRRLAVLAPAYLSKRLHFTAVELAARPADLPEHIAWHGQLPPEG